jgi:hypothetical protein
MKVEPSGDAAASINDEQGYYQAEGAYYGGMPSAGSATATTDQPTGVTPGAGQGGIAGTATPGSSTAAVNTGTSVADIFQAAFGDLPPDLAAQVSQFANTWVTQNPGGNSSQFAVDLQSQPFYKTFFAGNQTLISQGKQPLSPSEYLSYVNQAQQLGHAAGLPAGFMSKGEIDQLIGGGVSMQELSERVNNAYLTVNDIEQNNPGVSAYLAKNYGIGKGGLLAYVMDPSKALPALEKQLAGALVSGAATQAGLQPVSVDEAMKVASAIGGASTEAGGSSLNSIYTGAVGGMKDIAPDVGATQKSLTGVATVSQDQLIGSKFIGDMADVNAVQRAVGSRTQAFRGGGGPSGEGQPGQPGGTGYGTQ